MGVFSDLATACVFGLFGVRSESESRSSAVHRFGASDSASIGFVTFAVFFPPVTKQSAEPTRPRLEDQVFFGLTFLSAHGSHLFSLRFQLIFFLPPVFVDSRAFPPPPLCTLLLFLYLVLFTLDRESFFPKAPTDGSQVSP